MPNFFDYEAEGDLFAEPEPEPEPEHASIDHGFARSDARPDVAFQAQFVQDGEYANHAHEVVAILTTIFPNMPVALNQITPEDPSCGLWLVPIPQLVAQEVGAGVEFGWTEVLPYDFGEGESIVSILVPAS